MANNSHPHLLSNALPEFAVELTSLLKQSGADDLADQVSDLLIVDRCRCDEPDCGAFFVHSEPKKTWVEEHEDIKLYPETGERLIVEVCKRRIVGVELIGRESIHRKLAESERPAESPMITGSKHNPSRLGTLGYHTGIGREIV